MQREVHPAAGLFPLMSDEELRALADDVRENGLRQPVVVDGEGRVLDGRNRLRACELAGVEPEFVSVNGADPLALVVSLNVKRRNLTSGQRAIAAAEAWGLIANSGTKQRDAKDRHATLAAQFGVSKTYVQQARALVERAPDLAAQVKSGVMSMPVALEELGTRDDEAKARAAEAERRETERQRLATDHADLFEAIERGDMTIVDAMAEVAQREAEAERLLADDAQSRRVLTRNVAQAIDLLQMKVDGGSVRGDVERLDPAEWPAHLTMERVGRAAEYMSKFHEAMQEVESQ